MSIELKSKYYIEHLKKTTTVMASPFSILGRHHTHLNDFIQRQVLALPSGSSLLDGGCGLSIWVKPEIRKNYNLQSLDCQSESLEFCRRYYHDRRYVLGDLYQIPFPDDSFDAVVLREVIEHIKKPELVLTEVYRVLKNNGRLILTTPNYSSPLLWLIENIYNRFFSDIKPYLADVHPSKFKFFQLKALLCSQFSVLEYGTIDLGINLKAVAQKKL